VVRDARDTRCLIQRKQELTAAASPATPLVCQGFRGLEHLGSTVPSLRQATDFFADVLGWPIVNAFTPTSDPPGDFMTVDFDCTPGPRSATWRTCVPRYSMSSYWKAPHPTKPRIATDAGHWWPALGAPRGRRLKRLTYLVSQGCQTFGEIKDFAGLGPATNSYILERRSECILNLSPIRTGAMTTAMQQYSPGI